MRFTPNERGIELLRGEAVFDVVSDRDRPFVVRGAGLIVRAVGTRFFVRLDGAAEIVGVAEGRVEAAIGTDHTMIAAGEAARKGTDNRIALQRSDVEQVTAWRNGRLIAVGKPLTAILAELNRYRRGRILLLDAALGTRRFTGTLNLRDTDDALAVLSASLRLKVTRVTPSWSSSRRRPDRRPEIFKGPRSAFGNSSVSPYEGRDSTMRRPSPGTRVGSWGCGLVVRPSGCRRRSARL
ncbi:FecR family protein [Methylorubrum suomiense]